MLPISISRTITILIHLPLLLNVILDKKDMKRLWIKYIKLYRSVKRSLERKVRNVPLLKYKWQIFMHNNKFINRQKIAKEKPFNY